MLLGLLFVSFLLLSFYFARSGHQSRSDPCRGCRHADTGCYEWMVYNPADLAAVASGAKQQWQIQPEYEWTTPTLQFGPFDQQYGNGYTGDGNSNVGGVVFDPTTNRL